MFAELIFILFSVSALLLIDSFSTIFGLIVCALLIYCCVSHSFIVLNKRSVVVVARRLWTSISFCFHVKKQVYSFYRRFFLSGTDAVSPPSPFHSEFCGATFCIENEVDALVANIAQCYIEPWYAKISSDGDFSRSLNGSIRQTLLSLCSTVTAVDKKRISYIVMQVYLHFFSHFVQDDKKNDSIDKTSFKVRHWAMKDKTTEWCYLQSLVSALLDSFSPSDCEKTLHSKNSPLLHTIVVEILTQNVIQPLVKVLSDPIRLNLILLKALENAVGSNENVNNSSGSVHNQQGSVCLPQENCESQSPMIILPNEDSLDDSVFINENVSSATFIFPDQNDFNTNEQVNFASDERFIQDSDKTHTRNFLSLASSGFRSSSNANLFDVQEYSVLKNRHCYEDMKDTTIKRSKSADFIRQIPQLKALNENNYNIELQSEAKKMYIAVKQNKANCFIEQAEEAIEVEVPSLFANLKITETCQENEDGIPYTRYCIQYKGLFHDTSQSSDVPQFVQQVILIKRRFKEFVALHSSLEDNQYLRGYLKAIKAPSKWLLPFSNMDKKHIAERKIFLESYLNQLCSISAVAKSAELQEFLAYGKDENSFSRRYPETFVPRIDKIFVRGVKGAFDMIKTALPNSPIEDENLLLMPRTAEDTNQIVNFKEHLLDYSSREPEIKEHIINYMDNSILNSAFDDLKCEDPITKRTMLRTVQSLEATECCNCPVLCDGDYLQEKCPFGNTVFELLAACLELHESSIGEPFAVLKLLCVPFVNEFFINKLEKITDSHLCNLLHMLHKLLWPGENKQSNKPPENKEVLSLITQNIKGIASSSFLFNTYSGLEEIVLDRVQLLISSFQNQEINKCLLFYIFDAIIEATCL